MRRPTKRERAVLYSMGLNYTKYPDLATVQARQRALEDQVIHIEERHAWLRAAERRMAAGATSPFEARSEAEEADHG